jgi:hypothetical protein
MIAYNKNLSKCPIGWILRGDAWDLVNHTSQNPENIDTHRPHHRMVNLCPHGSEAQAVVVAPDESLEVDSL